MKIFCQNVFTVLFTIDFVSVPGLNLNVNQGYTSHIFSYTSQIMEIGISHTRFQKTDRSTAITLIKHIYALAIANGITHKGRARS